MTPTVVHDEVEAAPGAEPPVPHGQERLYQRLEQYRARQRSIRLKRRMLPVLGLTFVAVGLALWAVGQDLWNLRDSSLVGAVLAIPGVLLLAGSFFVPTGTSLDADVRRTEDELDFLEQRDESAEDRAYRLFRIHQYELEKYYGRTSARARGLFVAGMASIVLGSAVIGVTVIALSLHRGSPVEQVTIGAVGATGGLALNLVAIVFLKMYGEATRFLGEFHNRLMITHHLHFANFLAAQVDDEFLKRSTLNRMAEGISASPLMSAATEPDRAANPRVRSADRSVRS